MLPDHIAGYIYSLSAYGKGPENEWAELITEIERVVSQWPQGPISVGNHEFTDEFPIDVVKFEGAAALAKTDEGREIIAMTWGTPKE